LSISNLKQTVIAEVAKKELYVNRIEITIKEKDITL
jgi:hypothetical protein